MSTRLTDDERNRIIDSMGWSLDAQERGDMHRLIQAVLAKLEQQADRQRVPDEPDWRHPKIQALIGADARNRICIDLVWRILENPRREFTAGDMEYWDKLHDKVQEVALAAAPEAPAQAEFVHDPACKMCEGRGYYVAGYSGREDDGNAPIHEECDCWIPKPQAQASAVDERAAFEKELRRQCFQKATPEAYDLAWCMWQARAALAQKGGAVAEPTSYSHLAEQVSRLMTIGGATITERQQDVLAAALKALEVGMPTRYPITPERVTPDMRTDDEKLADLRGNTPVADYEHKKPDDTEGGAL